jgi:hypothetical protein
MTWRNTTNLFPDRVCAALAYLLPLTESIVFAQFVLRDFPLLAWLLLPTVPLGMIYKSIPFGELIVFFILILGVVRNPSISRFIRFNVMQAILIDIILFLLSLLVNTVLNPILVGVAREIVFSTIFLGILGAAVYGISQCLAGIYPDKIPGVSEAANAQVPF